MAGTTTYYGVTYPTSTDYVKDGATAIQTVATGFDSAVAIPTYNAQTGATYTFALTDVGKTVTASNASASTYTIPPTASVAWPTNTTLTVVNLGAGVVTFAAGAGVTVNNTAATLAQYQSAELIRTALNTWSVVPPGAGAKGMTLLSTTTLSGASTTVSSIPQTYADLEIWVYGMTNATGNSGPNFTPNGTANLIHAAGTSNLNGTLALVGINNANIQTANSGLRTDSNNAVKIRIQNYASATNYKNIEYVMSMLSTASTPLTEQYVGVVKTNTAISSMTFTNGGGNWSTGTVQIWGS